MTGRSVGGPHGDGPGEALSYGGFGSSKQSERSRAGDSFSLSDTTIYFSFCPQP
jgi:hypothetical protein